MIRLLATCFVALTLIGCSEPADEPVAEATPAQVAAQTLPKVTTYKTPTCGCCTLWVDHMREAGFEVEAIDFDTLDDVKQQYGISLQLQSCHTSVVDGYIVEGHVPASDVKRLLAERPDAGGLAVPGMPIGSPGMEIEGQPADRYRTYLVTKAGLRVWEEH
ncbi:MAG: DUF411 domain-containing protein [Bacteroidota bacterium]